MQLSELEPILAESATAVLESMFFTTLTGEDSATQEIGAPKLSASLEFHGDTPGSFGIETPLDTGRSIASSFLGLMPETVTEQQTGEVVCELANMLCGSVLSRLEGDSRFDLTHPELDPPGTPFPVDATARRVFQLDEGPLAVWLRVG